MRGSWRVSKISLSSDPHKPTYTIWRVTCSTSVSISSISTMISPPSISLLFSLNQVILNSQSYPSNDSINVLSKLTLKGAPKTSQQRLKPTAEPHARGIQILRSIVVRNVAYLLNSTGYQPPLWSHHPLPITQPSHISSPTCQFQ